MKPVLFTLFLALLFSGAFTGSSLNPADESFFQQTKQIREKELGWLGVSISDVAKQQAEDLGLKSTDGAYISRVVDDSPADSIGLKKGDVIVLFAGRQIYDAADLSKSVKRTTPGTKVALELVRKGEKKTLNVIVGSAPGPEHMVAVRVPHARAFRIISEGGSQGMMLMALGEQLAQYFEVPEGEGVLVTEVKKSSAAEKAGIKAGDVLLRAAGKRIDEVSDIARILGARDEGEKVDVELLRKGSKKTVTMTLEENEQEWNISVPRGHLDRDFFVPGDLEPFLYKFEVVEPEMLKPEIEELELKLEHMNQSIKRNEDQLRKTLEGAVRIREPRTI